MLVTLTYPAALPPDTTYWKHGPQAVGGAAGWYAMPGVTVSGNQITFTLTDGALGDDDLTVNGTVHDPGGPLLPAAAVLSPVALLLLAMVLLGLGVRRSRGG